VEAVVARTSWFDEKAGEPIFQEQLKHLDSFTTAMADGVVTRQELSGQEKRLVEAMKSVEGELSDALHDKTTKLLVELTAYNIMRLLHELQAERARVAFDR
jgi:predicted thioredoxin/glutaredoxin